MRPLDLAEEEHGQVVLQPELDIDLDQVGPAHHGPHVRVDVAERNAQRLRPLDLSRQLDLDLLGLGVLGHALHVAVEVAVLDRAGWEPDPGWRPAPSDRPTTPS